MPVAASGRRGKGFVSSVSHPTHDVLVRMTSMEVHPGHHHYVVLSLLHKWIRESALPMARGVLLDFGCGGQPYRELFGTRIERYIGADVTASNGIHLDVIITPGEALPLPRASVDTILSTQTLEHIYDTQQYIQECHRLLRPGGILILTVPMQWRM